ARRLNVLAGDAAPWPAALDPVEGEVELLSQTPRQWRGLDRFPGRCDLVQGFAGPPRCDLHVLAGNAPATAAACDPVERQFKEFRKSAGCRAHIDGGHHETAPDGPFGPRGGDLHVLAGD